VTGVPNALRALILDFDGVVLESNGLKAEVFREVFGRFPAHVAPMMAWHEAHISLSRYAKFEHLVFERLGRPDDRALVDDLAADFSRRIFGRVCTCPEVPGALAFLEHSAARVPLHLASVTPERELLAILDRRGLRRYFTSIFGCPPWTKPGAVASIVASYGGAHGLALIGDSPGDRLAAESAAIEFIGRDSGIPYDPLPPALHPDMTAVAAALFPRLP
jgi:phosphoglycolate phosphatase